MLSHKYSHVLKEKTRPKESTVELLGRVLTGMMVRLNILEKYRRELEYGLAGTHSSSLGHTIS